MYRNSNRMVGFAVSTALVAGLLTGCATQSAPRADLSASRAEAALAKGKTQEAIAHAEAAVQAQPRNAAYRATLGSAYLDSGRFASAETTLNDAMKLGDTSARTALSLALALDGQAKYEQAAALLNDWEKQIAPSDLGLAYSMSSQPGRGIEILTDAIRGGDNTAKTRQNLAYSYALAGHWREARVMASQDVPANQVGDRMAEWAQMVQPQAWQARVATIVGAPVGVVDEGQPVRLALANNPGVEQLASEAAADARPKAELAAVSAPVAAAQPNAPAPAGELPAVAEPAPQLAVASARAATPATPSDFKAAFSSYAPSAAATPAKARPRLVEEPVVQTLALRNAPAAKAVHPAEPRQASGTHLIQLGSFASEQGARRAWGIYVKHYPQLAEHQMVLTQAVVRGKHYWRVSAGGFGLASSQTMCGRVKNTGQGCFAYAEGRPLPGAVDTGTRLALR